MSSVNPYEAPQASLQNQQFQNVYDDTSPFSASGRFGRANYVVYAFGSYLVLMLVMGVATAAASFMGDAAAMVVAVVGTIAYVAAFVFAIIFLIRRLHDLNWSGWLSVLTVVPIANLVIAIACLFIRGSVGPNNYGPPPRPNKTHNVLAAVFVVLMVIGMTGIIAAIAIPAYQGYLQKAQEMSQQMPQ